MTHIHLRCFSGECLAVLATVAPPNKEVCLAAEPVDSRGGKHNVSLDFSCC